MTKQALNGTAPARGQKAEWIREFLGRNPEMGPTEAAQLLTEKAQREGVAMTFASTEVSNAKSKAKKTEGSSASPDTLPLKTPDKAPVKAAASTVDQVIAVRQLILDMGADDLHRLVDALR